MNESAGTGNHLGRIRGSYRCRRHDGALVELADSNNLRDVVGGALAADGLLNKSASADSGICLSARCGVTGACAAAAGIGVGVGVPRRPHRFGTALARLAVRETVRSGSATDASSAAPVGGGGDRGRFRRNVGARGPRSTDGRSGPPAGSALSAWFDAKASECKPQGI